MNFALRPGYKLPGTLSSMSSSSTSDSRTIGCRSTNNERSTSRARKNSTIAASEGSSGTWSTARIGKRSCTRQTEHNRVAASATCNELQGAVRALPGSGIATVLASLTPVLRRGPAPSEPGVRPPDADPPPPHVRRLGRSLIHVPPQGDAVDVGGVDLEARILLEQLAVEPEFARAVRQPRGARHLQIETVLVPLAVPHPVAPGDVVRRRPTVPLLVEGDAERPGVPIGTGEKVEARSAGHASENELVLCIRVAAPRTGGQRPEVGRELHIGFDPDLLHAHRKLDLPPHRVVVTPPRRVGRPVRDGLAHPGGRP